MTALPITLTNAGMGAIAGLGGTDQVTITQVGLCDTVFVAAPTLTALPGEYLRIDGVGGEAVDPQTIHITARDPGTGAYSVRGFALYLSDGTLFASYCQALPIFTKVAAATFLLAADIRFSAGIVGDITFGNANFLYPPATEAVKGVAEIATQDETNAGTDDQRIVTPKTLSARLLALLANVVAKTGDTMTGALLLLRSDDVPTFTMRRPGFVTWFLGQTGDGLSWGLGADGRPTRYLAVNPNHEGTLTGSLNIVGGLARDGRPVLDTSHFASDAEAVAGALASKALTPLSGAALVANRIAQLVASSPAALDTLAELAAALANDPNFAASVNAALAARVQTVNGKGAPHVTLGPADVGAVAAGRVVTAGGIATGGGALSGDITITVTAASGGETQAGVSGNRAVTPAGLWSFARSLTGTGYAQIPGTPLILQWGSAALSINANQTITLPIAYPSAFAHVFPTFQESPNDGDEDDEVLRAAPLNNSQFSIGIHGGDGVAVTASWWTIGW